jgi:hypothetical protein
MTKRRKTLARGSLATLLAAAALLLSGCWAQVKYGPGYLFLDVKQPISDNLIWGCTVDHGSGDARANCVLDNLNALCRWRVPEGLTAYQCYGVTDRIHVASMGDAIEGVLGPNSRCLSGRIDPDRPYQPGPTQWMAIPNNDC